eukprot:CAMPEP_0178414584 /NCGR_PEP_ID=MMETSP0689_2-20121128/23110_1 /TAXON_ID=160604 /ORGANISM="Amphidinium massartii, Strain CS-259" /LENGTH=67 /DNA_ID=CAMNT_0020035875 /DNA_START=635 /DNA_END=838 /DNA_ORIENTATION=+
MPETFPILGGFSPTGVGARPAGFGYDQEVASRGQTQVQHRGDRPRTSGTQSVATAVPFQGRGQRLSD